MVQAPGASYTLEWGVYKGFRKLGVPFFGIRRQKAKPRIVADSERQDMKVVAMGKLQLLERRIFPGYRFQEPQTLLSILLMI